MAESGLPCELAAGSTPHSPTHRESNPVTVSACGNRTRNRVNYIVTSVSTNYRELTSPDEIFRIADECAQAWMDPNIPERQYELAAKAELEKFALGRSVAPFDALGKCIRRIPPARIRYRLLDVGASAGYYKEVLNLCGFPCNYTACDFSPAFKTLAEKLYPGIHFDVADARTLPYPEDSFDIVLNGACMMHNREYEKVLAETVRVSKRYVIMHRTPVLIDRPTTYYEKEAYGVRCLEIHFSEKELLVLFDKYNLELLYSADVFWEQNFGHRTYLLQKIQIEPYASIKTV